jgi:hypothetical protein
MCDTCDGFYATRREALLRCDVFLVAGRSNGALTLPPDINLKLFTKLYNTGAKVQSMSWGSTSNKYTNDAR